ncbi:cytochrome P450 [Gymnopilus junonius]|uniref:Cytochrome P450 n=1 Tax=Gymnopilus junonius TaxID=109634 RepID=A0A9P5TQG4_GYMJU|nr:cytochrome P450 [Gymnopilus junonius]
MPPLTDKDEPLIKRIHAHTATISASVVPGAYLVDLIPPLKHVPTWMARWKREGLAWHQRETAMFEGLNREVEEKMRAGNSPHCFVSELVETRERHELTDKEAAWLAGIMFSAGAETVCEPLLHPLRKAQAELDAVVGRDRIPTFEDQKNCHTSKLWSKKYCDGDLLGH